MRGTSDNKKIWGDRMLRKKDPKYQTGGEFFQQKGAFLDHKKCHKIDVFQGGGGGAGREAAGLTFCPVSDLETTRCACKNK